MGAPNRQRRHSRSPRASEGAKRQRLSHSRALKADGSRERRARRKAAKAARDGCSGDRRFPNRRFRSLSGRRRRSPSRYRPNNKPSISPRSSPSPLRRVALRYSSEDNSPSRPLRKHLDAGRAANERLGDCKTSPRSESARATDRQHDKSNGEACTTVSPAKDPAAVTFTLADADETASPPLTRVQDPSASGTPLARTKLTKAIKDGVERANDAPTRKTAKGSKRSKAGKASESAAQAQPGSPGAASSGGDSYLYLSDIEDILGMDPPPPDGNTLSAGGEEPTGSPDSVPADLLHTFSSSGSTCVPGRAALHISDSRGSSWSFSLQSGSSGRPVQVGRSQRADVVLDMPGISWHHLDLRLDERVDGAGRPRIVVRDSSSNGSGMKSTGCAVQRLRNGVEVLLPPDARILLPLRITAGKARSASHLRTWLFLTVDLAVDGLPEPKAAIQQAIERPRALAVSTEAACPQPQGEAAVLLAELQAAAPELDARDYWVSDAWDLEALREDVQLQREELGQVGGAPPGQLVPGGSASSTTSGKEPAATALSKETHKETSSMEDDLPLCPPPCVDELPLCPPPCAGYPSQPKGAPQEAWAVLLGRVRKRSQLVARVIRSQKARARKAARAETTTEQPCGRSTRESEPEADGTGVTE